jgi:hypothetical protein
MPIDYSVLKFAKGPSRFERKDARKKAEEAERRRVYKQVDKRDGMCCRVTGRRVDPHNPNMLLRGHHHHLTYRSKGGNDTTDNLILLSAEAHHAVHAGRIRLSGDADAEKGVLLEVATEAGFKAERWI